MIKIQQGEQVAEIDPLGAELRSLRRDGDEFIWQDTARVWPHAAPILFPFVGRLRGGGFVHGGHFHAMPIHGFAAGQRFDLVEQQADSVLLQLRANAGTRACYPFEFCLRVRFTLQARGLTVAYDVSNEGREELAFGLGSHPAFALGDGPLTDWHVEFEQAEALEVYRLTSALTSGMASGLDGGLLLTATPTAFAFEPPRCIRLTPALFADDALIFKQIRSRTLRLIHARQGTRLSLHTGGAPHLGLWAKSGAAFVCIEPWFGVDEDAHAPLQLAAKPGLLRLAPGERFSAGYWIEPG